MQTPSKNCNPKTGSMDRKSQSTEQSKTPKKSCHDQKFPYSQKIQN